MSGRFALVLVVSVLTFGCGDSVAPTAPSPSSNSSYVPATGGISQLAGPLSGHVVCGVSGEPARAQIEVPGHPPVTTDVNGFFTLQLAATTEALPLVLRSEAFYTRETHLAPVSEQPLEINLMPRERGFDLDFFDHVFRNLGEDGTERWTNEPQFEIWTKIYECHDGEFNDCDDLVATARDVPGRFISTAREVILADAPKFTGGFVRGTDIVTTSHEPGTRLTWREYLLGGKITVILVQGNDFSFAWNWPYPSGRYYASTIQMNMQHKEVPFVYSHELAHTLGFSHPLSYENIPLPSVMRGYRDRPTRADMLHGALLYKRPPGSRTPDKDPEWFAVNAQRTEEFGLPDPARIRKMRD